MALKPLNSTGGFTTGEISQTPIPVVAANGWVISGNVGNVDTQLRGNGYFITDIQYSNLVGAYGNANVGNYLASNANVTILTTGNITTTANIAASYFIGNGAFLTGINAGNLVGAYSNANVANYLASGDLTSNIITTGNISGTNLIGTDLTSGRLTFVGAEKQITDSGDLTFNSATNALTVTGNISGGNLSGTLVTGTLTTAAQPNITSVGTLGALSVTGNITTQGNINAGNAISANYFIGNGYYLTGLDASNVIYSGSNININIGFGNIITGGNVSANVFTSTTNVTIAAGAYTWIFNDNTGNFTGTGNIVTSGNAFASYYFGNGYYITGIEYSNISNRYSNTNVQNYLPTYVGDLNATNYTGNFKAVSLNPSYANGTLSNSIVDIGSSSNQFRDVYAREFITPSGTSGNATQIKSSTTGSGIAFVDSGSGALADISAGDSGFTGNIEADGFIQADQYIQATGNVIAGDRLVGNLQITSGTDGSLLYRDAGNAKAATNIIVTPANAGIQLGNTGQIQLEGSTGNIIAAYYIGNGSQLTGINGANIVGGYGNANVKAYLESGATINANFGTGTVTTSGNVNGGNLVSSANIDGTNVNATKLASSGALTINSGSNGNIVIQPNGSGNIVLSNTFINSVAYPVQDQDAASKVYVDNLVSTAISYHESVVAATTTTLAIATGGTITYNQPNGGSNGVGATLSTTGSFNLIDSANIQSANARILVKNEANGAHNGIYVWTNATVITRADDEDTPGVGTAFALGLNDYFFVTGGNVNLGTAWIVDAPNSAIVFGTSSIQFAQFSQSQVYSANNQAGLQLIGQQFNAKTDNNTTAFDGGGNIIVKAGANLTTPNIGNATGSSLNVTGTLTGGNIVTGGTITATGDISGGNLSGTLVTGTLTTAAQPNITSVGTLTSLSVTGNVASLGNVSANLLLGNGYFITGIQYSNITGTYGDANVAAFLPTYTGNLASLTGNVTTTANVQGAFLLGNGAFITGLPAGYSNVDTQNYLANSGNIQINWTNGGVLIQGSNTANSKTGFTTVTSNSTSATTLVSIDAETNDAVQFLIKGQDTVSGAYQVSKVHSLTDGLTTLDYATFGDVALLGGCGTIQVSLSSGNVVLQVTPKSANAMTWTATYTSI